MIYNKEKLPATQEVEGQVPPNMRDRYSLRITESEFMTSSKGNPMIHWTCEIIDPLKKEFDKITYALNSLKVEYYLLLDDRNLKQTLEILERFGKSTELDTEDPESFKEHEGLIFDAILNSAEDKPTKPDPSNPGKYIPIVDADGKPISHGWKIISNARDILMLNTKVSAPEPKPY